MRIYAALIICPMFAKGVIPRTVVLLLASIFAIIIIPQLIASQAVEKIGVWLRLIILLKELGVGIIIGFVFSLPLWLVENVGNLIDAQRGEELGAVINQSTKSPSSSLSKLLLNGFYVYLLEANGLLLLLKTLWQSYGLFPLLSLQVNLQAIPEIVISAFAKYFFWLVVLALPVVFLMFIVEISLGIFSSFVQKLNVTNMAMPIKSIVAIFFLVFYVGIIYHVTVSKVLVSFVEKISILWFTWNGGFFKCL